MKVDGDPFNIAETNYVEPIDVNMVYIVGFNKNQEDDAKEVEGYVMINETREATEDLTKIVSHVKPREGLSTGIDESGVVKGPTAEMPKATEGLRVQFKKVKIVESHSLGIDMVDSNQPFLEMEEVERCLEMEKKLMRGGYPKVEESLSDYLF